MPPPPPRGHSTSPPPPPWPLQHLCSVYDCVGVKRAAVTAGLRRQTLDCRCVCAVVRGVAGWSVWSQHQSVKSMLKGCGIPTPPRCVRNESVLLFLAEQQKLCLAAGYVRKTAVNVMMMCVLLWMETIERACFQKKLMTLDPCYVAPVVSRHCRPSSLASCLSTMSGLILSPQLHATASRI